MLFCALLVSFWRVLVRVAAVNAFVVVVVVVVSVGAVVVAAAAAVVAAVADIAVVASDSVEVSLTVAFGLGFTHA